MENAFLTYLSQKAFQENIPFSGQFELTPVCNLNCKMCYIHNAKMDAGASKCLLPASFWISLAEEIKEAGTMVLSLTGGETLLYPELDKLMDALSQMGFLISFNTNGTLIDEKRVEWFRRYAPTKINITLYGACNETYEQLCGIPDGFDRVSWAIEHLQQAGLNVYLNGVIAPEHVDQLPAMHAFAAKFGLTLHTTAYLFPQVDEHGCPYPTPQAHRLPAREAAEVVCKDMVDRLGQEVFQNQAAAMSQNINMMTEILQQHPSMKVCRAGKCLYTVSWKGRLRPCALLTAIEIPLYEEERDFISAWKELGERIAALPAPEKCLSCGKQQICPVCKGALYRESGDFQTAPEYLCQYSDQMEAIAKREAASHDGAAPAGGELFWEGCLE